MIKIRKGVFETNSSSTHSITMCTKNEYDDWKNGKLYLCINDYPWTEEEMCIKNGGFEFCKFYPTEEVKKFLKDHNIKFYSYDMDGGEDEDYSPEKVYFITYDEYSEYCYRVTCTCETYVCNYITPNGENVVACGYYGHD